MTTIEIKSIAGAVLWSGEARSVRHALEQAVSARANLTRANLTDANLAGANLADAYLTRANLTDANLTDANLTDANLTGAYLTDANLTGAYLTDANLAGAYLTRANLTDANLAGANLADAYLTRANLTDANLTGANLTGANLTDANLADANLTGANLADANLTRANLTGAKEDLYAVLAIASNEAPGLLAALREGRVDGTVYSGECACLVGTIANLRHEPHNALTIALRPDSTRPAEVFFLSIGKGDTPESNPIAALAAEWIEAWIREHPIAPPTVRR